MTDPELLEEVRRPAIGVFPMGAWDPSDASGARGAATALLTGVDDFTTERCRLFNASYQACA